MPRSCLHALAPCLTVPDDWGTDTPNSCPSAGLSECKWFRAWRMFTAMGRINAAPHSAAWNLIRPRGTLSQRLTNNAGNLQSTPMRAQASWLSTMIHMTGSQRTLEQVSTMPTFTAADHRRLRDAHHQWGESGMRKRPQTSRGGRLIQIPVT